MGKKDYNRYGISQERDAYLARTETGLWQPISKRGTLCFGKFRTMHVTQLKSSEPEYFFWCCANVEGFRELAEFYLKNTIREPRKTAYRNRWRKG